MWPDRLSNTGPLAHESDALPIATRPGRDLTESFASQLTNGQTDGLLANFHHFQQYFSHIKTVCG